MFQSWIFLVVVHLILATVYNQTYKALTSQMLQPGPLTILIELTAGATCLLAVPFFDMHWPTEPSVYFFLILACVFYALNDRLCTTVRKGMDTSVFTIIKQFSTVFMIFAGIFFFKEEVVFTKLLGAFLIVFSNVLVFFDKGKIRFDKYIVLGLLASFCAAIALFIDVNCSEHFNLAFYVGFTLVVPAVMIWGAERISFKALQAELQNCNLTFLSVTGVACSLMTIARLGAFQYGEVVVVSPLCSLVIMTNILVELVILKEKTDLAKKITAGLLILLSIWLIQL
ncbi:MAG: hypothetical protein IKJ77_05805 [Firmicutes bacterium]|nr:hypothetical protein [Bacillota bacterium]